MILIQFIKIHFIVSFDSYVAQRVPIITHRDKYIITSASHRFLFISLRFALRTAPFCIRERIAHEIFRKAAPESLEKQTVTAMDRQIN